MKPAFKNEPYGYIDTEIGRLAVYYTCLHDHREIEKEIKKNITEVKAYEYFLIMVKYICHKSENILDDKSKPHDPNLTNEDISKLSKESLNKIAELYLENNDHLYKEKITSTTTNEEGKQSTNITYGKIIHQINENEDKVEYLFRLICIEYNEMKEQFNKIFRNLGDISPFSKEIQNQIKSTFSLGKQLSDKYKEQFKNAFSSLGDISPFSKEIQNQIKSTFSLGKQLSDSFKDMHETQLKPPDIHEPYKNFDYASLAVSVEENRLKPFREIQQELQELIEYMRISNKTQTSIATEIKDSSDKSSRHSKTNILISIGIIILTSVIIGFSIYNSVESRKQNNINVSKIVEKLENIDSSVQNEKTISSKNHMQIEILNQKVDSLEKVNQSKTTKIKTMIFKIMNLNDSISTIKAELDSLNKINDIIKEKK
ncbi:MAG: hypothetical protein KAU01_05165 [Candidatus Cloacimonetes bacterium]|nr:hypothetical protein [Candidatus Cloacimonadota bacterium]